MTVLQFERIIVDFQEMTFNEKMQIVILIISIFVFVKGFFDINLNQRVPIMVINELNELPIATQTDLALIPKYYNKPQAFYVDIQSKEISTGKISNLTDALLNKGYIFQNNKFTKNKIEVVIKSHNNRHYMQINYWDSEF